MKQNLLWYSRNVSTVVTHTNTSEIPILATSRTKGTLLMASLLLSRRTMFTLCIIAIVWLSLIVGRAQASPIPQVWSIVYDTANTDATSVRFVVTFSEAVTGVDISDFSLSGDIGNAIIQHVAARDDAVYLITIAHAHASRGLMLAVLDDDSIRNVAGIALGGQGVSNGSMVSTAVVIRAPVTAIEPVATQPAVVAPAAGEEEVGWYSSLALTTTNLPVISYFDKARSDTRLLICNNLACSDPIIRILDYTFTVGEYTSLALTTTNNPVVSYYFSFQNDLMLAMCNNPTCTTYVTRIVDGNGSTDEIGKFTSLALTSTNIPIMSYVNGTSGELKLAICNNPTCTAPIIRIVDSSVVAQYTSVKLLPGNIPVISYYSSGFLEGDLKLAICNNPTCTAPIIRTVESATDVGTYNSLALTSSGIPVISYHDFDTFDLKLAVCSNPTCTSASITTLDSASAVGQSSSLVLAGGTIPVVSYLDSTNNDLKLAICNSLSCTDPQISILDSNGYVGSFTSLALMPMTNPLSMNTVISYHDITNKALKLYTGNHPLRTSTIVDKGLPLGFAKSLPANNAINQPVSVTLRWIPSSYSPTYEYCYATSIDACTTWTSVSDVQVTVSGLSKNTTYYWQVRATNTAGTIVSSGGYWKFTTVK